MSTGQCCVESSISDFSNEFVGPKDRVDVIGEAVWNFLALQSEENAQIISRLFPEFLVPVLVQKLFKLKPLAQKLPKQL